MRYGPICVTVNGILFGMQIRCNYNLDSMYGECTPTMPILDVTLTDVILGARTAVHDAHSDGEEGRCQRSQEAGRTLLYTSIHLRRRT